MPYQHKRHHGKTYSRTAARATLLAIAIVSGCATPQADLYQWGRYETLILDMYTKPGKATPAEQIQQLEATIQLAENQNTLVGPGIYAHLGFMYTLANKPEKAQAASNVDRHTGAVRAVRL
ncbi:MAG: DUF4810 domain-containing protein [Gammaproteobacteria bacterium]